MKNFTKIFLVFTILVSGFANSQGNTCATAVSLGSLPTPVGCGGPGGTGLGATINTNGTNVGATAANPYTYIPDCGTGTTDMAFPAIDVWYSFVATGTQLVVSMTGSLATPNFGLYTGTCNNLSGLGCALGTAGGALSATFEPLTPGDTYYIQISGNTAAATGNFNLVLNNNFDCNDCMQASTLTVNPLPINGTYGASQTVTFCYTVEGYTQVSSNWLHGVQLTFGSGWDPATLVTNPPPSCSGSGTWDYYPTGIGTVNGVSWGAGFYYDYSSGAAGPQNNYGDYNAQNCDPQFCWTITTDAVCSPGAPLSISVNTSGDGESGSWTSIACQDDAATTFEAISACCNPPTMSMTTVTCAGGNNGSATATISSAFGPWDYVWYNQSGVEIANLQNSASTTNTINTLTVGTYTVVVTDNNGCASGNSITVTQAPGVTMTTPSNITVCNGGAIAATNFTSNPAGATYTWTNTDATIGIGASGSGNIGAFNGINLTGSPITATITVTPTLAGCAGTPASYTITVTPAPVVTISGNQNICPGASTVLSGTFTPAPTTTAETFTNTTLVQIPNGNAGGGGPGYISVTSTGISPTTLSAGQIVSICFTVKHEDFSELLDLTFSVNGTTYTSDVTPPLGQTYSATLASILTSIIGSADNAAATFCLPAAFLNSLTGNSNTTFTIGLVDPVTGADKGDLLDITVVINDTPVYSYVWSPIGTLTGSTSGTTTSVPLLVTATPVGTTTYDLQITDPNGCIGTGSIIITPSAPTAAISGTQTICTGGTASLSVALTGSAPWSITYTDGVTPTTISGIMASPYTISASTAGTYTLTDVTSGGCSGTVSGSAVVSINPPIVISNVTTLCAGPNYTVEFDVSGGDPATYSFSGGTGTFSAGHFTSDPVVSGAAYSYTVTDVYNCGPQTISGSVNCSCPVQGSVAGGGTVCSGQAAPDVVFTLTGGTVSPYTLTYAINGVPQATVVVSAGFPNSTYTISTPGAGMYSIVSIADGGCTGTASGSASVAFNSLPTATVSGSNTLCAGSSTPVSFSFTGSGPWSLVYSIDGVNQPVVNTGSSPYVLNVSTTGSYAVVSITDVNSCAGTFSGIANVVVNPLPTVTSFTGGNTYCSSDVVADLFVAVTGSPSWTLNYTLDGVPQSANSATSPFNLGNAAGVYVLSGISDNNCSNTSALSQTIVVNPDPVFSVTSADPTTCNGTDGNITISGLNSTSSYDINYTDDGTPVGPISVFSDGSGNIQIGGLNAGTYTNVTVTIAATGCSTTNGTTLTLLNPAGPTVNNPGNQTVCDSYTLPLITGTNLTTPGYWTATGGTGTQLLEGDPVTSTQTIYVYDINGACSDEEVFTVTVTITPTFTVSGVDPTVCNASDGSITISGLTNSTAYSVSYDDDGTAVGPLALNSDASGNILISGLNAGSYDNFTVSLNSCTGSSATIVNLNNPGAPVITDLADQTVCDTYTLPAITGTALTGNEGYWTATGGTGTQLSVGSSVTTTQTIYIYDINGSCSDEETFVVTVNNTPSITNPGAQTACASYTLPAITGTNLSGNEAYYDDSQANSGTLITGPITSSQTVWIYDAEGTCSDEESFSVPINPLPTVTSVTGGGTYCTGVTANDIMVAVTGSANWTVDYTLNGVGQTATGSASPINLGNAAGVYVITNITDANCSNTASGTQTITINPIPNAPTAGTDTTYCSSWTVSSMTATGTGGTMTWYTDAALTSVFGTGNSITPNDANGVVTYYVTETALGCEGPASTVTITIEDCQIIVPTAFTPDADNINDVWEIVDLDAVYPDNVVTVFNRWGNKLFESEKGQYASKPWNGTFEGDALPVGSYYYIIDFNLEDVEPAKGIVSIILE